MLATERPSTSLAFDIEVKKPLEHNIANQMNLLYKAFLSPVIIILLLNPRERCKAERHPGDKYLNVTDIIKQTGSRICHAYCSYCESNRPVHHTSHMWISIFQMCLQDRNKESLVS